VFIRQKSIKRILFFLLTDIILISLSVVLAFLLRFSGDLPSQYIEKGLVQQIIVLALVFCLPIFYFFGLYSFSWKYVSTKELIALFKAVTISFFFLTISFFVLRTFKGFPRSVIFITYFLVFIFCGAFRFSKRIYLETKSQQKEKKGEKTIIVGAGDAGEQILRSILNTKNSPYLPVGFVDDDSFKQGLNIHGVKVLGKIDDLKEIILKGGIMKIIVALPSVKSEIIKKAVEISRQAGIKDIKIVPSIAELINEEISLRDLRDVNIEDLLAREPIFLETKDISDYIKGKKVLVTGAAGSIGSELSRQVAKFGASLLLLLDQDETGIFNISREINKKFPQLKTKAIIADIRDKNKIESIFRTFRPDIIFHAAAYKHVPLLEENIDEAVKNNVFGTKIIAEAALKWGAEKFIFISTDKAVNPISVMGATKRIGEMICQSLNNESSTKFIVVRFGNVLDSRGSVIPIFKEQIKKGGPVEVTHPEIKRYFMTIPEACLLVTKAGAIGKGGEIFVLDMGKPIKIFDLAREMIKLSGFEPDKDIPIVFSGLRPGEKLYEEIIFTEERIVEKYYQKILKVQSLAMNKEKLDKYLSKLKEAVEELDNQKILKVIKEIVPSFEEDNLKKIEKEKI